MWNWSVFFPLYGEFPIHIITVLDDGATAAHNTNHKYHHSIIQSAPDTYVYIRAFSYVISYVTAHRYLLSNHFIWILLYAGLSRIHLPEPLMPGILRAALSGGTVQETADCEQLRRPHLMVKHRIKSRSSRFVQEATRVLNFPSVGLIRS